MNGKSLSDGHRLAIGAGAGIVVAAVAILIFTTMINRHGDTSMLTLLVIGGAVTLVAVIALVATIYSLVGLTDPEQAMGLPEGSVRSVIALLLLVVFAMLAVFFYNGLQAGGSTTTLSNQSEAQLTDFIAKHPDAANLSITVAPQPPAPATNTATNDLTNGAAPPVGPPPAPLYNIAYGGGSPSASDFAKTLMAALETLLTTVVGFYFGARTATSSAAATAQQIATGATPPPNLTSVDPASVTAPPAGGPAATVPVTINGSNLNSIVNAHLERTGDGAVPLTSVASNPTQVTGQLAVTAAMSGAPWDVVVVDGAGNTQRLKGALTVGA